MSCFFPPISREMMLHCVSDRTAKFKRLFSVNRPAGPQVAQNEGQSISSESRTEHRRELGTVHLAKSPAMCLYRATFNDLRALFAMLSSINYND